MYSGLPRNWTVLAARGVLAILFGLFALSRLGIALPLLVIGFGVAVLLSGVLAIVAGVRAEENDERSWPLTTEGVSPSPWDSSPCSAPTRPPASGSSWSQASPS